ncbi:lysine decarboxylase LdcC [Thiotrichales bacterium 19S9-12]|nr:lysine decarboxylase LdcC [Thiotrichales bacterium 19S9-11]MCF6812015.1 lysine decarboxylase LdcC [Thiotrichales bacterium 19S9-12]
MQYILFVHNEETSKIKLVLFDQLKKQLESLSYSVIEVDTLKHAISMAIHNARVSALVLDWGTFELSSLSKIATYNPILPIFALGNKHVDLDLDLRDFDLNLDFLQYDASLETEGVERIHQAIKNYSLDILPPFTRQLMHYVSESNYSFCTPGHQQGYGFQKSPVGVAFYDYYGANIFKSDISISMSELGSLLDHSGPHKEAEKYISDVFNSDRSLIVTNGTSTSNKIVGMYAASDGDTILVDRNCHKSLTHLMMMVDVNPIYLKPTRNAHGILGGIRLKEFSKESIQAKLDQHPRANSWPVYAVITNSTYDGIFYNVNKIHQTLDVKTLHFDSAWVPYTNFHPIYQGKYGMGIEEIKSDHAVFETQSTHKLIAAFSQASMIHAKGDFDSECLNETFMMHTSTSPFYPIVASTEVSAAMMQGSPGYALINECIELAMDFRQEIVKLREESSSWFYEIWQPEDINEAQAWPLQVGLNWHGFDVIDDDYLYLDPVKVTVLLPGIDNNQLLDKGIPASIVAQFLEDHGIIVEKTGPYSMLFLFSIGITKAKSMRLLAVLNKFKQLYDQNRSVKEVLPSIYQADPIFYKDKSIQEIADILHQVIVKHNLPEVMYHAFDYLPEFVINPHRAFQKHIKNQTKMVLLEELEGETSAVMILPYPPGIPLIMPGERITKDSRVILDFLLMLIDIGSHLPGFETDIHGVELKEDGKYYVKVIG